jgi:hypothetical protein
MSSLFIGAALPGVFAGAVNSEKVEHAYDDEPCKLCRENVAKPVNGPGCESCKEAVAFAVDYMKDYVSDNVEGTYFLWTVDVSILIFQGLVDGFKESGYTIVIDVNELKDHIEYWVNRTVGQQKFTVTQFLAKLGAITIGVTRYLLTLCIGDNAKSHHSEDRQIRNISWLKSESTLWIILKHLLGLFF